MMDTRQGLAFLFGFGQRFFLEFSDDEPKARLGRFSSKCPVWRYERRLLNPWRQGRSNLPNLGQILYVSMQR